MSFSYFRTAKVRKFAFNLKLFPIFKVFYIRN